MQPLGSRIAAAANHQEGAQIGALNAYARANPPGLGGLPQASYSSMISTGTATVIKLGCWKITVEQAPGGVFLTVPGMSIDGYFLTSDDYRKLWQALAEAASPDLQIKGDGGESEGGAV